MQLNRKQIKAALRRWNEAWDNYDLDGVMDLFHESVVFDNWTGGSVKGKAALRKAWQAWFINHGNFRFIEEDTFIAEKDQKVLYRWRLEWPSMEKGHEGMPEKRRGVDVIHFKDGKIIEKLTYSKTSVDIDGERCFLHL